jgi:sugar lactone lactonase YvrE
MAGVDAHLYRQHRIERQATISVRLLVVLIASLTAFLAHASLASAEPYPEFNFEFGKEGTGNGQFKEPSGIATDSEGNIWVVDTGNNRVEKFNEKGEYLFQFGEEGTGNGQFKGPKGIGIDSENNIWVVDTGNNRLQKFNPKGEYLSQIGKEGTGNGEFKSPTGIALGNGIAVTDTGNNRVQRFNEKGEYFASQFGKEGAGAGEFKSPTGIGFDWDGHVWVADSENDRVQEFGNNKFVSQFGKSGTGNGELDKPMGIAVDFQGRLWVADSLNNRAQKFDKEDNYLDQFGSKGSEPGKLNGPSWIAAVTPQKILIVDQGNDRVEVWTVKAEPPRATVRTLENLTSSSATMNATIYPEALSTTYYFDYGKTTSYGSKIPISPESVGSGTNGVQVNQTLTELPQLTTYHYRVVAASSAGTITTTDHTFKTLGPPIVTTEAATNVKGTSATLNGKVDPERSETSYWFEYGKTESYGTKIPISPESIGSGNSPIPVSQSATGLTQGTTYHFRVVATNTVGTTYGTDKTLTTLKAPKAITEAPANIKGTAAKLNGTVNPEGSETNYWFEYGETESYGTKIPVSPESVGAGTSNVAVAQSVTGLTLEKTYHYRLVAENTVGTSKGEDKSFETKIPSVGTQLAEMGVTEIFDESSTSLERFSANWSTLGWTSGTTPKGSDTTTGWGPVSAYPTLNGTYYNSSVSDAGAGLGTVATMAVNPANANRYFSLWLDMPTPSSTRGGYELRFTDVSTNTYKVTLSKWVEGSETELASEASYAFNNGNSFALVDQGGTVSAWTDTGSGFSQLLSAGDSTFEGGNAGVQGAGNITRLTKFKVSVLEGP